MIRIIWLFAVVPLLGLPRTVGSATVSDSSSFFARGELKGATVTGVDSTPQLDLSFMFRHVTVTGAYAPRLVLASLAAPQDLRLMVLHNALASVRYTNRRSQISLGQYLSIGEQYLGTLPQQVSRDALSPIPPSTSRAPLLATTDSLRISDGTTSFVATHRWTERWTSGFYASYALIGGADAASRALSPRFKTAAFATPLDHRLTERAELQLRASASYVETSVGPQYWISDLTTTWRMTWAPDLTTTLTGGAAWLESRRDDTGWEARAAPTIAASVSQKLRRRLVSVTLRGGGSIAPYVNALTAELQTTMQGSVATVLAIEKTEVVLSADGSRSLPLDASDRFRVLGIGARLNQAVVDWLLAYAQFRALEQHVLGSSLSLRPQWLLLAGVSLSAPRLDF